MTIHLEISDNFKRDKDRSLIGKTDQDEWADILQEKIRLSGFEGVQVRGISHDKFILTFLLPVDKQNIGWLHKWFKEIKDFNNHDLVQPRLAWIHCDGLPISTWTRASWEKIIGDWGTLISDCNRVTPCNMFQKNMVCIETERVLHIEETFKVQIGEEGFWVKVKETKFCFDKREIQYPPMDSNALRSQDNMSSSNLSLPLVTVLDRASEEHHNIGDGFETQEQISSPANPGNTISNSSGKTMEEQHKWNWRDNVELLSKSTESKQEHAKKVQIPVNMTPKDYEQEHTISISSKSSDSLIQQHLRRGVHNIKIGSKVGSVSHKGIPVNI
ncbi:hypothetical protein POM88_007244 [Heracleum sosnowskyi]|uniref:DUF4283 domain-containing protein n=1 Tax=Heracleum sosnowskyi TaxID=360622 RepID=A0AAD8N6A5_9APIA|nr:hypothetical protein POM88_007244 [Heracleum sosnowskyi]